VGSGVSCCSSSALVTQGSLGPGGRPAGVAPPQSPQPRGDHAEMVRDTP
jgi:hypothetical protein